MSYWDWDSENDYSDEYGDLYSNIVDPGSYSPSNMYEFGGVSSSTDQKDIGRQWYEAQTQLFNYDIDPQSARDDWLGSMNLMASIYQPMIYGTLPFGTSIRGEEGRGIQGPGGVYVNAPIIDGTDTSPEYGLTKSTHPAQIIEYLLSSPEGAALSRLKIDEQEHAEIEETFDVAEKGMRSVHRKRLEKGEREKGESGLYSSSSDSLRDRKSLYNDLKYLATEEEAAYDHFFGLFGQEVQNAFMSLEDRSTWDAFGPEGSRAYDEDHWFDEGRMRGEVDEACMNDYIVSARENGTFDFGTAFEAQSYCS